MFNSKKVTRARGDITQSELARRMSRALNQTKHLTALTRSLWERGVRVPGANNLWAMARATSKPLDYFFGR